MIHIWATTHSLHLLSLSLSLSARARSARESGAREREREREARSRREGVERGGASERSVAERERKRESWDLSVSRETFLLKRSAMAWYSARDRAESSPRYISPYLSLSTQYLRSLPLSFPLSLSLISHIPRSRLSLLDYPLSSYLSLFLLSSLSSLSFSLSLSLSLKANTVWLAHMAIFKINLG